MNRASPSPVLVALVGAVAACGRPNPGFDVADGVPGTSTGGETTAIVATATATATATSDPTTTAAAETTTALTVTTTDATTTTTTGEPGSSSEGSSSTGMPTVTWPTDCANDPNLWKFSGRAPAVADTFLLHEQFVGGMECSLSASEGALCRDVDLGQVDYYEVMYLDNGSMSPSDDYASVYAVRFPEPVPVFEGLPVEEVGWLLVRVTVRVVHVDSDVNPWMTRTLDFYRFAGGDVWSEGLGFGPTPCVGPGASWRCRRCAEEFSAEDCGQDWKTIGYPFTLGEDVKHSGYKLEADPMGGADVVIDFPADDWKWLMNEGMLMVPRSPLPQHVLEVKTKDYDQGSLGPFIEVVHCAPEIGP